MKQVVAYLLYKHDEGSYTLQRVKFEKEAYQSMLSEYVCLSGNEDDVLSRLPLIQYGEKTPFNLLFVDDEGIRVIPAQVEENFWDKYIEHDSILPASTRDEIRTIFASSQRVSKSRHYWDEWFWEDDFD